LRARTTTVALLATAAVGVAACGSDNKSTSTASGPAAAEAPATTTVQPPDVTVQTPATTPTTSTNAPATPTSISKDLKTKPAIPTPTGTPPTKLVIKDIVKGKGRTARVGKNVTVQYVGVSWSTGQQFDASWDRGQPFQFQLGDQHIIRGWNQGVAGMKVGGRRELVIPPELGYGAQGSPPTIAPNETLVFVIDLLKVR
jgi:peptidylprolyl isomerase